MIRRVVVVRPEPGNAATVARARALGWIADAMPLFAVESVAWTPPDPALFDSLLLTSANAVRHAGPGLARLDRLPVLAVGEATAAAARAAGLAVALTGSSDVADLLARAVPAGFARPLHLAGRERTAGSATTVTVYASLAQPAPADAARRLADATVLLHSPRAARAVAALVDDRRRTALAAFSAAVADAAGSGWRAVAVAARPCDNGLLAAATTLPD